MVTAEKLTFTGLQGPSIYPDVLARPVASHRPPQAESAYMIHIVYHRHKTIIDKQQNTHSRAVHEIYQLAITLVQHKISEMKRRKMIFWMFAQIKTSFGNLEHVI